MYLLAMCVLCVLHKSTWQGLCVTRICYASSFIFSAWRRGNQTTADRGATPPSSRSCKINCLSIIALCTIGSRVRSHVLETPLYYICGCPCALQCVILFRGVCFIGMLYYLQMFASIWAYACSQRNCDNVLEHVSNLCVGLRKVFRAKHERCLNIPGNEGLTKHGNVEFLLSR